MIPWANGVNQSETQIIQLIGLRCQRLLVGSGPVLFCISISISKKILYYLNLKYERLLSAAVQYRSVLHSTITLLQGSGQSPTSDVSKDQRTGTVHTVHSTVLAYLYGPGSVVFHCVSSSVRRVFFCSRVRKAIIDPTQEVPCEENHGDINITEVQSLKAAIAKEPSKYRLIGSSCIFLRIASAFGNSRETSRAVVR